MSVDEEIRALLSRAAEHDAAGDLAAAADVLGWARQQLDSPSDGSSASAVTDPLLAAVVTWRHADLLCRNGDLDTAYRLARHLVDDLAATYGPRHPAALRATGVLGRILHAQGRLDDADRLYRVVLGGATDDADLAGWAVRLARADRAQLIADRGDPGRAVPLLSAAVAALHGPTRQHTAVAARYSLHLAALHDRLGTPAAAADVLDDAAAEAHSVFGPDHPLTAHVERLLTSYTTPATASKPRHDPAGRAAPTRDRGPDSPGQRAVPPPAAPDPQRRQRPRWHTRAMIAVAALVVVSVVALAASAWSVPGAAVDDRRAHPATPTAAGPTGGQPPASSAPSASARSAAASPAAPQQIRLVRNPPTTLTVAWRDPTASSPALLRLTRSDGAVPSPTPHDAGRHHRTPVHGAAPHPRVLRPDRAGLQHQPDRRRRTGMHPAARLDVRCHGRSNLASSGHTGRVPAQRHAPAAGIPPAAHPGPFCGADTGEASTRPHRTRRRRLTGRPRRSPDHAPPMCEDGGRSDHALPGARADHLLLPGGPLRRDGRRPPCLHPPDRAAVWRDLLP
ncbi:hypothetical protein GCM10020218_086420 [Dactylosporangium vinaceum]